MKYGIRTPNIKKSLKARTTGKAKRALKKSINPVYGKKGVGIITDPKKAVYNKVYNKTTVSVADLAGVSTHKKSKPQKNQNEISVQQTPIPQKTGKPQPINYFLLGLLLIADIVVFICGEIVIGIVLLVIFFMLMASTCRKN